MTDVIFVGQQLIDRSFMSRLGSVMVNSGGLAAYRCSILAENIDTYLNESYLGRHVEFSDDSLLTLFALLHGRTVQQPSAFAFAWMPDRWSHHLPPAGALVPRLLHPRALAHPLPAGPLVGLVAPGHRVDAGLAGDLALRLPRALASARRW